MDLKSLFIAAYSGALMVNNKTFLSRISGVIVFRKNLDSAALAHLYSRKCQRVTPRTFAGEFIALTTVFDAAFVLRNNVSDILGRLLSREKRRPKISET